MTAPALSPRWRSLAPLLPLAVPLLCLLWAFSSTLTDLALTWHTNPQYSPGFLVPAFPLALLYLRRDKLDVAALRPSLLGLLLLVAALALRLAGAFYYFVWL